MSIIFDLERTNQLNPLPDKDLVDLCPPIEPYQVTKSHDFSKQERINHRKIIDQLSYNTKNDKAFALSGKITNRYMRSEILHRPRINKSEIREIILGGGQNLLSPERRFDAIIYNSPDLFNLEEGAK
nr:HindVP family restriction endonuclease [Microcystis sp. LEGE 00066]